MLNLGGERSGDMVVKYAAAIPINLHTAGFGNGFPDSLMGALAYVRQVWLDADWNSRADATYIRNVRVARPRYDRTEASLSAALKEHEVVLIPANDAMEIRRSLEFPDRWRVNAVLYGADRLRNSGEIAAKNYQSRPTPSGRKRTKTPTLKTSRR